MKTLRLIAILAAGFAFEIGHIEKVAAAGCAATGVLASFQGNILVDRGDGFKAGAVGLSLKAGDKVSVVGPGNAVVDFGNSRLVNIAGSSTETLRAPGCSVFGASNGGAVATIAVVGGVAAAIALSAGRKSKSVPVSP
ncbi:MAG: hypothetical protein AB7L90_04585 [Hyphomicrobiaceae bacterium]